MGKFNARHVIKNIQLAVSKHSPEILTGIGIAGMITTTVLAVRATPKALELLKEAKVEKTNAQIQDGVPEEDVEGLTPVEVVKTAWKPYIPAAVTCVFSTACLIGASSVNAKRNAALATAYKLSETALSEYREKVVETVGERKEKTIREKIDKDRLEKAPTVNREIIITGSGTTQCFDPLSGRYFESSIEEIKKAENNLNKRMLHDIFGYVSLNEFYDELGLDHVPTGDDLGWRVDKGLIDIDFSTHLADNGKATVVIDYLVAPKYGYDKLT